MSNKSLPYHTIQFKYFSRFLSRPQFVLFLFSCCSLSTLASFRNFHQVPGWWSVVSDKTIDLCSVLPLALLYLLLFNVFYHILFNYASFIINCITPFGFFNYCTVLHCTALHCTALHCTALYCTASNQ